MSWSELVADPGTQWALEAAGQREIAGRNDKKRWSEQFADACAIVVANAMRRHVGFRSLTIRPDPAGGGRETFTPLGRGQGKRIDVVAYSELAGLQVGISLKGLGFADERSGNFDKNLTGRLYELRDEVSVVHEHLPKAVMVAMFFLPLAACEDKTEAAPSSFAKTVAKLRGRTGRLDPHMESHAHRCDLAFVCLYGASDDRGVAAGISRWFDVGTNPPRRGRPILEDTLDLDQVVHVIADHALADEETRIEWAPPAGED